METNKAIIIGAGPAGLTAAMELLERTQIVPTVLEKTGDLGGISKTVQYKGNRIDIGGHRFFSKSDRVMNFWEKLMPFQQLTYDKLREDRLNPHTENYGDKLFLLRQRVSRILYNKKLFDYPITLSIKTLRNLGLTKTAKILGTYVHARLVKQGDPKTLEGFFINRLGSELYKTFFKSYTEKLWGVPATEISSDWGAQRIKGVSLTKVIGHAVKALFAKSNDFKQKNTETSLVDKFLYPKYGPGQLWEEAAAQIISKGGQIHTNNAVTRIYHANNKITKVETGSTENTYEGDYFFSSMPVKDLINGMIPEAPQNIKDLANGLAYRDFITVGLLLDKLAIQNETSIKTLNNLAPDNWLYIQEPDVNMCRIQIFNNWSPFMVKDPSKVWVGLEYICSEHDSFWAKSDPDLVGHAILELESTGIAHRTDVIDSTVLRVQKAYPAYFGTYTSFGTLRDYLNNFTNLFLIGRNGMHRYNNQDHSVLSAMVAVDNIINGVTTKNNIWNVNAETEYHEERAS